MVSNERKAGGAISAHATAKRYNTMQGTTDLIDGGV